MVNLGKSMGFFEFDEVLKKSVGSLFKFRGIGVQYSGETKVGFTPGIFLVVKFRDGYSFQLDWLCSNLKTILNIGILHPFMNDWK